MKWEAAFIGFDSKISVIVSEKSWKEMTQYSLAESDGIETIQVLAIWEQVPNHPLKIISLPFEGTDVLFQLATMPISAQLLADYMTSPPADKQLPHHDAVIADMG